MPRKYLVIGIGGPTSSGKSTLAEKIQKTFPSVVVMNQDYYFLSPGDERLEYIPELDHHNWDTMSALDMEHMCADVQAWMDAQSQEEYTPGSPKILLIEGFLIFNYRPLCKLFDKMYYVTIEKETCAKRRAQRTYEPPDVPGYFEKIVWPMYLKYSAELQNEKNIEYLNGMEPQEKLQEKLTEDLSALCKS